MPTIVVMSPKGGSGKTTTSLILASQLAKSKPVAVIDADPNHPVRNWASDGGAPAGMSVVSDADEETIIERIEEAAAKSTFVIVDLEGTASKLVLLAVSQADLVLIPTQGSQLDAEQAGRALKVVRQQEKMSGRKMPFAVVFTRTNPTIRTRTLSHIQRTLIDNGVPVLQSELHEREAFRAMFSFRRTLENLDTKEVANLDRAIANAAAFTGEIIRILREKRVPGRADAPPAAEPTKVA